MQSSPDGIVQLDEFGFHHRLAAAPGVALVMFASAGCGSCRAWRRVLSAYRRSHPAAPALYEVDAGQALALTREFSVFHLPAFFVYRDGRYHGVLECVADPDALDAAIAAALARPAQEPP